MKVQNLFMVSLIALFAAGAARADIASTAYVDEAVAPKQQKIAAGTAGNLVTYSGTAGEVGSRAFVDWKAYSPEADEEVKAASVASVDLVEGMVMTAAGDYVRLQQGQAQNANKAMITSNTGQVVPGQIAEGMIAANAVTSAKIANGTIVAEDIADNAVTTDKIADGNVTLGKLASAAIDAAPTQNSNNLVKSGGVYSAIGNATTNMQVTTNLSNDLDGDKASTTKYPSVKAVYDADKAINDKIGSVAAGKTVVEMISDAKSAATGAVTASGSNGVSASASNGAITVSGVAATSQDAGVIRIATDSEASTGTATGIAVNPKQLKVVDDAITAMEIPSGITKLTAASDGQYVLTAKVVSGVITYGWENIGRTTATSGD